MSQRIAVCALSIPKILDLLNDDESDNFSFLPPVKPKGGEIISCTEPGVNRKKVSNLVKSNLALLYYVC